jgi:hypothetical protein
VISSPSSALVGDSIEVKVNVSDNVAVNEVRFIYIDVSGIEHNESMSLKDGVYSFTIPSQSSEGSIRYFIWANDTSQNNALRDEYSIVIQPETSGNNLLIIVLAALIILVIIMIFIYYFHRKRKKSDD